MSMSASRFLKAFQQIRAFVAEQDELADDFSESWSRLQSSFKSSYEPADFKAALAEDRQIPDHLEEQTTSTLMVLRRETSRSREDDEA